MVGQAGLRREVRAAGQHRRHRQVVPDLGHVVDPEEGSPSLLPATAWPTAASVPASRSRGGRPVTAPTKSLRDRASSSGRPRSRTRSSRRSTSTVWAGVLAKSGPGSRIVASGGMPASAAAASRSARNATTSPTTSPPYRPSSSTLCLGSARVCMTTSPAPALATSAATSG